MIRAARRRRAWLPGWGWPRPVPEPRQDENRLLPAAQGTRVLPGADLAAVLEQQLRHEQNQWKRDVKGDTIGQHAEPPGTEGTFSETSCTGGSAPSRGSPDMSACLPGWALRPECRVHRC